MWIISFIISLLIIVAGISFAALYRKNDKCKSHFNLTSILICTVFISSACLFFPVYRLSIEGSNIPAIKAALMSLHNSIRLFVVDGDFQFLFDFKDQITPSILPFYEILVIIEFIVAPILTFSFVLSFFKDLQANMDLFFSGKRDAYVFSELNERSILLAEDIYRTKKNPLIVFTDVFETEGEEYYELSKRVNMIDGLCFRKDITKFKFKKYKNDSEHELMFFLCSDNTTDNKESIEQFIKLDEKYRDYVNCSLYYFSSTSDSNLVNRTLDEAYGEARKLKVYRVNESVQLVYNYLYESGINLYKEAYEENGMKKISVIINGLDNYGSELLKGLIWFLRMKGYDYEINCFDSNFDAEDKMRREMPEVFLCNEGKNEHDPDVRYNLKIYPDTNFDSVHYVDRIKSISNPTFVFTSLGSDTANIELSTYIKRIIDREFITHDKEPDTCRFVTIVKNSTEKELLKLVVYKDEEKDGKKIRKEIRCLPENFELIGDYSTLYSYNFVTMSKIAAAGLERHHIWGGKDHQYYGNEYNYKSSISSAIHIRLRKELNIPGANVNPKERTPEEKDTICRIEHDRWSAYTRTNGFIYNKKKYTSLKLHNCLIPFDELDDKNKDNDNV